MYIRNLRTKIINFETQGDVSKFLKPLSIPPSGVRGLIIKK